MIKEPIVGMYVFKQHKESGRYIFGKIIEVNYKSGLLIIDIIKCNDYGFAQKMMGKYEGCSYIHTCSPFDYEIIYGNSYAEILAKVM